MSDHTLNTIGIPVQERYAHILEAFDSLQEGDVLRLIVDHDPGDLCQELHQQRPSAEANAWQQTGQNEWEAIVTRGAKPVVE